MKSSQTIGLNIKRWRKQRGISVSKLASKVGLSRAAVYYYESGKRQPSIMVGVQLSKALGVTLAELTEGI